MNWGKLCSWNNHLEIFCFLFRISLFLVIHFISLLYTTFSGTYVRDRASSSATPLLRKSEVGRPSSAFVCSRLRESSVRWIEKARTWKKIKQNKTKQKQKNREETRERKGPSFFLFSCPPPQLFACLSLWPLPHSFMSSPLSLLSGSLKQVRVVSICKRCIMHACKLHIMYACKLHRDRPHT